MIPVHSQHVERWVYLTSQAYQKCIGYERSHQWLLNKMKSCEELSIKCTKEDFIKLLDVSE